VGTLNAGGPFKPAVGLSGVIFLERISKTDSYKKGPVPQGLKPAFLPVLDGMAKAMPFKAPFMKHALHKKQLPHTSKGSLYGAPCTSTRRSGP